MAISNAGHVEVRLDHGTNHGTETIRKLGCPCQHTKLVVASLLGSLSFVRMTRAMRQNVLDQISGIVPLTSDIVVFSLAAL